MVYYLKYNLIVSRITMGMYKLDQNAPKYSRYFYKSLRVLCNIAMFSGLILTGVNMLKQGSIEIDKMAVEIMTIIIFFSAIFRTNYFYLCEDNLEKVVNTINQKFKRETSTGFEEKSLKRSDKVTKIFVIVWSFSVFFTGQFMALLPLFVIRNVGRILPLPLWYPYDWKQTPYYELTYFTQIVTQNFMVFSYGNSDMFFSCTTIMITEQFALFGWTLKNLIYTTLLKEGVEKSLIEDFKNTLNSQKAKDIKNSFLDSSNFYFDSKNLNTNEEILKAISTKSFKINLNRALVDCIKHYQILLDVCDQTQTFFSPLLLPEMLLGIFYCIFIMYAIAVTSDVATLLRLVEYLAMCYAEIFCLTYLGQKLFDESEDLLNQIYEIPWYLCDQKFKKMFNILQTKLTRPITITAWKFFDMKLTTFLFAIKTSFSFLAFLRQVTEEEH